MKTTIQIINTLMDSGIIARYAIAGGMAHFYYIEPSVTYDLDVIVRLTGEELGLDPLSALYEWASREGYSFTGEHIVIGGIPVQFLLAYNELVDEALNNADNISLFDESTFIFKPEYLMAIMLQTNRLTDRERFARFLADADFDKNRLLEIIKRHNLLNAYLNITDEEIE